MFRITRGLFWTYNHSQDLSKTKVRKFTTSGNWNRDNCCNFISYSLFQLKCRIYGVTFILRENVNTCANNYLFQKGNLPETGEIASFCYKFTLLRVLQYLLSFTVDERFLHGQHLLSWTNIPEYTLIYSE